MAGDLERMGDLRGAREHYQRALAYRPLFPKALNGLGAVLYRTGEAACGRLGPEGQGSRSS